MPIFQLPKTIRWLLVSAFFFFVMMSLYRWGIYRFLELGTGVASVPAAFWAGFRLDARLVGAVTLLQLLISFLPGLHFYKSSTGRNTGLIVYSIFTTCLLLFSAADTASLFIYKTRLSGNLFTLLSKKDTLSNAFLHNTPWIVILLLTLVAVWLSYFIFKALHTWISKGKSSRKDHKLVKVYWQLLIVLLCVAGIWGRIGKDPLSQSVIAASQSPQAAALATNPIVSFFSSK